MKKGHTYEIDYTTRTITVTRAFAEAASQMDNDAFDLMQKLIALGMNIQVEHRAAPRITKKVLESRKRQITRKKMLGYINNLDDAEAMLAEYETIAAAYPGDYQKLISWFWKQFPNYEHPEFDEDGMIVHNPNSEALAEILPERKAS